VISANVLVLTNMYPTEAKPWWGTFVAEQVDDLRRLDVNVSVLDFDATNDRREYARAAIRFRKLLRQHRYDLIHAHYGLTGAIAVAQRRVPVITTFHGGDYTGLTPWHAWVSKIVARLCVPVVVTPDGRRRLGVPDATVIPAGINTELFRPMNRVEARRALGLKESARYALLLGGRNDPNKRADIFDAAVAHARKREPTLVGMSLDYLNRKDVVLMMNSADVAVLTSDTEGMPVAVREALAVETPVVSVAVGSVPRVLDGLEGCSVVPRDGEHIGDAIVSALHLARAPQWRARAEETSGATVAARLLALYITLVREAGSARSSERE
jgi:glycosyltransferase involved in cell wall biosynthesis